METDFSPLTPLEEIFKTLLGRRPDIRNKIPDTETLTHYFAWMAEEVGEEYKGKFSMDDFPIPVPNSGQRSLAGRMVSDPMDQQTRSHLSAGFALHSELWNFPAGHDISIGHMLRYMPSHWHASDYFEVFYAPYGSCPIHFRQEVITLSQGAILIVAPDILHASPCYTDDAVLYSFMVRKGAFERVFWNQLPEDSLLATFFRTALSGRDEASWLYFDTHGDEELAGLCKRMYSEFLQAGSYNKQLLNALLTVFFITVLKKYESTARLPRTGDFYWDHEYSAIFSHIQHHYMDAGIEDVARQFHYSTRQVSRIVRQYFGMDYAHLILKLRMEQAAVLLSQGELSIAAVGNRIGYADNSSFYRAFTQYYGQTPKSFQQLQNSSSF